MSAATLAFGALLMVMPTGAGTARSADGIPIAFQDQGSGDPAVVLVHGWTRSGSLWDAQTARLAAGRRVVTLDLAGHGMSGRGRSAWTIEAFAADVAAVVDQLKLKRVVLVGHSMGGPVVVEAARSLGGRVAGVVLVDTLLDVEQTQSPEEIDAFLKPLRADYASAAERFAREYLFAPGTPPAVVSTVVAGARLADPVMSTGALQSTWSYDPRPALAQIRAPLRAINSDKWPTNAEAMRRHAPQFQLELIRGSGHYPMLERPAEMTAALERALAAIDAATPSQPAR